MTVDEAFMASQMAGQLFVQLKFFSHQKEHDHTPVRGVDPDYVPPDDCSQEQSWSEIDICTKLDVKLIQ